MAVRAAIPTGSAANFLTAATWALVDNSATTGVSYLNAENATESLLTTAYTGTRSSVFQWSSGAPTISGIMVKLCERIGTTGTMSVELYNSTDSTAVAGTEVTINTSSLPSALETDINGGWIYFKFGSPVALENSHNYAVEAKTSNASMVDLWCDSTADNLSRCLVTGTTGAPAAGDDLIITAAYIDTSTKTDAIVTMNETATTDYGSTPTAANSLITPGIAVCTGGRLVFPAGATSLLKISNSVIVYSGGILAMGIPGLSGTANAAVTTNDTTLTDTRLAMPTNLYAGMLLTCNGKTMTVVSNTATVFTGASWSGGGNPGNEFAWTGTGLEVGRSYSASLTFDCGANVDYGLIVRNLGTFYSQGLSRTAAKTFVSTLATTADVAQKTSTTVGGTAASPGVFTWTGNTLSNGDTVQFSVLGTVTGISTFTTYYVVNLATDGAGKFRLSLTKAGADINTTGSTSASGMTIFATSDVDIAVVDDTGWLDNDVVAIASTTRTYTQCEQCVLNGNAAAALLTFDDAMVYGHSATSPTQAEIILLTRNVKIYGASATLQAYIDIKATATVDCDWTEFYWLGSGTSSKYGISLIYGAGTQSFQYCSRHTSMVASSEGWVVSGGSGTGLTIQYCVSYNVANKHFENNATTGTWIVDSNIFIKNTDNADIVKLGDLGGIFTNNTMVGCGGSGGTGLNLTESSAVLGTFGNLTIHSGANRGFGASGLEIIGTISTLTIWRNSSTGMILNTTFAEMTISNLTMFGNTTDNILCGGAIGKITLVSPILNGDSTFSTTNGINFNTSAELSELIIYSGDFGTVSGIKTAHTNDINVASPIFIRLFLNNTILASTEVATQTNLSVSSFISSQRHDTTKGLHKTWMRNSTNTIDTTVYNTASPSLKITPTSVAVSPYKAVSAPDGRGFKVNVAEGQTCTPSVYVRMSKSSTGDAADYSGAQPRLILKRNDAMGYTADQVLDTGTVAIGNWEQLTGAVTGAATDDGVLEFYVDCDYGTANSFINVDDFTATVA
jgi:hypothetical protein